jgi:hypothetical protein
VRTYRPAPSAAVRAPGNCAAWTSKRDPLGFQQLVIEHGDSLLRVGDIADVVRRPRAMVSRS